MTVQTAQAPLPPITLTGGMQIIFEAISPTTGLAVSGVKVGPGHIYGIDRSSGALVDLVPLYSLDLDSESA